MRSHRNYSIHILSVLALLVVISGAVFVLHKTQANTDVLSAQPSTQTALASSAVAARDSQRVNDLKQMQNLFEAYYAKCGYYPGPQIVDGRCSAAWANSPSWYALGGALASGAFAASIPLDPVNKDFNAYHYAAFNRGQSYVLNTSLEDPTNPSLAQSARGNVNGVDCSGTMYCLEVTK